MVNGTTMEPLDSQEFLPEQKRAAIQNAKDIERQILSLIRIFSRKEMRDKLQKEFAFLYKTPNEIDVFNEQFARLKRLWMAKLSTPLEEFLSVQESLIKLRMSTKQLQEAKHVKEEAYKKDVDQAKEQREQRQKELEDLKNQSINKKADRQTEENRLKTRGDEIQKMHHEQHLERKKQL